MPRWQRWFFSRWGQIALWSVLVVVGWLALGPRVRWSGPAQRLEPVIVAAPGSGAPPPSGWTAVAKRTMPGVVNISAARTTRAPGGPFFSDPFFPYFFGGEPAPRRERSLGSGVIVTADGYVLTNNHVVEGAEDIRVRLADRREGQARLLGADAKTDLALLKLTGRGFPVVPFGDSNRVNVAEVVLAMGNPFGLDRTVTMGIVSAVGRANVGIADYEDFIQTDAAINPGNSGGALVNAQGALIGINTAIFTQSGGYMGIGFAIPVNMARQVMDQLATRGRMARGYLGVVAQELRPVLARGLGSAVTTRGVVVGDVEPGSPAARAGLQRGDVIVAIDGRPVEDPGHFRNLIAATPPGTALELTIVRDGREQTREVVLGELPDRAPSASVGRPSSDPLGLAVADVTPELARRLGLPPGTQGAVVVEVGPDGRAAEAGLRPGDVIQEVNRQPVRSARDFARTLEQARNRDLVALVSRSGTTSYVAIERDG